MPRRNAPSSRRWCSRERLRHIRGEVARRDGTRCHWCGRPLEVDLDGARTGDDPAAQPTVDHLVERRHLTRAEALDVGNVVLACPPCNNERDVKARSLAFVALTPEDMAYVNDP